MLDSSPASCLIFLLDRSRSMAGPSTEGSMSRADLVAGSVNRALQVLIELGNDSETSVGLIGYRTDRLARVEVGSLFSGGDLVPLTDLASRPIRHETRLREVADEWSGEVLEESYESPVWVEPAASGGTPLRPAFGLCRSALEVWISDHPDGRAPVIVHLTDGQPRDGDPSVSASELGAMATSRGRILLFHGQPGDLTDRPPLPRRFPARSGLADGPRQRSLFRMSSVLPSEVRAEASKSLPHLVLEPEARALVLDADPSALVDLIDLALVACLGSFH